MLKFAIAALYITAIVEMAKILALYSMWANA